MTSDALFAIRMVAGSQDSTPLNIPEDAFGWAAGLLSEIASDAARHAGECMAATALIASRGDRIDRLNAENHQALHVLTSGLPA